MVWLVSHSPSFNVERLNVGEYLTKLPNCSILRSLYSSIYLELDLERAVQVHRPVIEIEEVSSDMKRGHEGVTNPGSSYTKDKSGKLLDTAIASMT